MEITVIIHRKCPFANEVENRFRSNWTEYCSKHWNQVFYDPTVVCCDSIACSSMQIYHQTEQNFEPNLNSPNDYGDKNVHTFLEAAS